MEAFKNKKVLVSGASLAGLSTAYWMNELGYKVTVVEVASEPRTAGAAVDINGPALEAIKRMGISDLLRPHRLQVDMIEFKNAQDVTEGSMSRQNQEMESPEGDMEIERDKFIGVLFNKIRNDVEFIFDDGITALNETKSDIQVTFKNASPESYDLVFGCDGIHSGVRRLWFGSEAEYSHFLQGYFSIVIVKKLLIKQKTVQMYNVPNKSIMLNAYNNKTDVIFCFFSEQEILYDYRDEQLQRKMILEQFVGQSWRTAELLKEVQNSKTFYFDKFCQIKMPSWTKGRVALVGDAAYCASPAAGMGASLAINGATVLADALLARGGDFELAFRDYNKNLRPLIEQVQATAESNVENNFIPRTEEAINTRNAKTDGFGF